jgi:hypothetical protein
MNNNDFSDIFKKINELSQEDDNTISLHDSFDIELSESFVIETGVVGFMEDGVIVEADESMLEFLDFNGVLLEAETEDEDKTDSEHDEYDGRADEEKFQHHLKKKKKKEFDEFTESLDPSDIQTKLRKAGYNAVSTLNSTQVFVGNMQIGSVSHKTGRVTGRNPEYKAKISRAMNESFDHEELDEAEYQGRKVPLGKPMKGDVAKSKVYVKKPNGKVVKVNFGDKNMRIKKSNPNRRKSFRARHNCDNPGPRWKARFWSCKAW